MRIEELDKNLAIKTTVEEPDLVWFDVKEAPFELHGVTYDEAAGRYVRMPLEVAAAVSPKVLHFSTHTAGGRVRFHTDSTYIAIRAVMENSQPMSHMPMTGKSGFDLYHKTGKGRETFYFPFVPPCNMTEGYSSGKETDGADTDYTIHFPLFDGVKELYIALKRDAHVSAPAPYAIEKPVVYYGSSITHGGCASRPGNSYEAMISRALDADHVNLGFAGSAKGELAMAEYIATLKMSAFVMDYDHNTSSEQHLLETHEPFFKVVRAANPTLPVVFVSAPTVLLRGNRVGKGGSYRKRRSIIRRTYENALVAGDQNVYFVDGGKLFAGDNWDDCTVDGLHPNDLGFWRMAQVIGKTVKKALKL